jgi:hypothetical protein
MRSVTMTISLDAVLDRLDDRVLGEQRRHGDDRAEIVEPCARRLLDRVRRPAPVDLAAQAAGVTPPTIFAPRRSRGTPREVDASRPGDALDDERRVRVERMLIGLASTGAAAASLSETERSA